MRFVALVASIALSGTLFTTILVSAALAATTVQSTSENSVDQDRMTVEKQKSSATQLIDTAGFGLHKGCCSKVDPTFTPDLKFDDKSKGWASEPVKSLDKPVYVSGIKLTSKPTDKKNGREPNFAKFNFVPFLNIGGFDPDKNNGHYGHDDDDDCDDEEHEGYPRDQKHHHHHKDHGGHHCYGPNCPDQGPPVTPTPLPATLPLMGSVLSGFGFALWRRRRTQKAA
jgi:hypothetical protein